MTKPKVARDGWASPATINALRKAKLLVESATPSEIARRVYSLAIQEDQSRERVTLNLLAGENTVTPSARALLGKSHTRGSIGLPGAKDRGFPVAKHMEEVEALIVELAKKLFKSRYVEYRPFSGSLGVSAAICGLTHVGDTIISPPYRLGAHPSVKSDGALCKGLAVVDLPYAMDYDIDLQRLAETSTEVNPQLIALGSTTLLFPYPLEQIRQIADRVDARILYDGAHIGTLISAGKFQDPLREGADVLVVNTHKMMGGPQGALILSNDIRLADEISSAVSPGLISTPLADRYPGIAIMLAEHLVFAQAYAEQIIRNAKTLAKALDENGFVVMGKDKGYTETHQVVLDVSELGGGYKVADTLTKLNIMCNAAVLPKDNCTERKNGLRFGTQEATRIGMKEPEMEKIADLVKKALIHERQPEKGVRKLAAEVVSLRQQFPKIHYCFDLSLDSDA